MEVFTLVNLRLEDIHTNYLRLVEHGTYIVDQRQPGCKGQPFLSLIQVLVSL